VGLRHPSVLKEVGMNQKEFDAFTVNMDPKKVALLLKSSVVAEMRANDENFDLNGFIIWSMEGV
jgi:hypothetical protein